MITSPAWKHIKARSAIDLAMEIERNALEECERLMSKLEGLRGRSKLWEAAARVSEIGSAELSRRLLAIMYPPKRKSELRAVSEMDACDAIPDNVASAIQRACIATGRRDRLRAASSFCDAFGIHPDDVPASTFGGFMDWIWHAMTLRSNLQQERRLAVERDNQIDTSEAEDIAAALLFFVQKMCEGLCRVYPADAQGRADFIAKDNQLLAKEFDELRQALSQYLAEVIAQLEKEIANGEV